MVKIAIAGGSGQVAREVIDALVASGKHDITILSRSVGSFTKYISLLIPADSLKETSRQHVSSLVQWRVVDYNDKHSLAEALQGIETLLSFVQLLSDPENKSQKNLIDAAILAGVRRFAPSEYGGAATENMPWWTGKQVIRDYLKEVNRDKKVLEYTLFQPGLFLDYLASPYKTSKYVEPLDTVFNFHSRRAIVVEGHEEAIMTLTSVADLAAVVARAVEYEGQWPEIGGIRGNRLTYSQIVAIGKQVRGHPFVVDKVKLDDLEAGILTVSPVLGKRHHSVSEEQAVEMTKTVSINILVSSVKGAWDVSDQLNRLFPDHQFDQAEAFLARFWDGKP